MMTFCDDLKIVLVLFVVCAITPVFAQDVSYTPGNDLNVDVSNLEKGIPSCIEDAYVLPKGHFEGQAIINWGDADHGDWWEYHVQLAAGMNHNWQATAGVVFKNNDLDATGDGDVFVKLMRQFHNSEKDAALFGVQVNFPSGQDYARKDYSFPPFTFVVNERKNEMDVGLLGVYSRMLNIEKDERLHFEIKHTFVRSAPVGFADTQLFLGAGYDKLIREDTLAMAAVCWTEGATPCDYSSTVLQLGVRHKESRRFLWGAGVKIGLDWAAANWGLTWGAQYGL